MKFGMTQAACLPLQAGFHWDQKFYPQVKIGLCVVHSTCFLDPPHPRGKLKATNGMIWDHQQKGVLQLKSARTRSWVGHLKNWGDGSVGKVLAVQMWRHWLTPPPRPMSWQRCSKNIGNLSSPMGTWQEESRESQVLSVRYLLNGEGWRQRV